MGQGSTRGVKPLPPRSLGPSPLIYKHSPAVTAVFEQTLPINVSCFMTARQFTVDAGVDVVWAGGDDLPAWRTQHFARQRTTAEQTTAGEGIL